MPSLLIKTRLFHAFLLIAITNGALAQQKTVPDSVQSIISDKQTVVDTNSTLTNKTDTTSSDSLAPVKESSAAFDAKVDYKAEDSLIFNVKTGKVYLYGKSEVNYEEINLKSDYIELDLEKNEVFSRGSKDTSGEEYGTPVFRDKDQEFEAREMRYNFQTKKGIISDAVTQQGDGYVEGARIKRLPDEVIFIKDGKFCPCEDREAKTHIKADKIKIIPDDKLVTGVANLKLGAIPTPLVLPFGIFPNKDGAASGIIIPTYGYSPGQGYFLQRGGYYWAINDYMDASFLGDIYSRGSWGLAAESNYKRRYRSDGRVYGEYKKFIQGAVETRDLREETVYEFRWRHKQDPKATPNSNFSADVNVVKNNQLNINTSSQNYLSNNFNSKINFTHNLPNTPFRLTANGSYEINTRDSSAELTLPEMTLNMDRIYPFKRKVKIGKDRWYEKFGLTYTSNFRNKVRTHQDSVFTSEAIRKMQSGLRHQFGLNSNYKVLKVATFNPSFNYTEYWEFKELNKSVSSTGEVVQDTLQKFGRRGEWNTGANLATNIYGMYLYRKGPVKALRHTMVPSVGFTYTPSYENNNYYRSYTDTNGTDYSYSIFALSPNGGGRNGKESGSVNFELKNNFEMKVKNKKDTVNNEKKVKLLDQFNFRSSYDMFADSMNWRPISVTINTSLFNFFNINYNSNLNMYAFGDGAQGSTRINQLELDKSGKLGKFTNHTLGVNFSVSNAKSLEKKKAKNEKMKSSSYVYQSIPWSFSVGYNYSYVNNGPTDSTKTVTQSLSLNTTIQITSGWKFQAQTNYDFEAKDIGYTSFSLYRDMNCWEARIQVVPKGGQQNYNFGINIKPSMLKDLKLERKRNFYDFN